MVVGWEGGWGREKGVVEEWVRIRYKGVYGRLGKGRLD